MSDICTPLWNNRLGISTARVLLSLPTTFRAKCWWRIDAVIPGSRWDWRTGQCRSRPGRYRPLTAELGASPSGRKSWRSQDWRSPYAGHLEIRPSEDAANKKHNSLLKFRHMHSNMCARFGVRHAYDMRKKWYFFVRSNTAHMESPLVTSVNIITRSSADADNRLDAFSGQSRSTNMVPFHMLHIVSYCAIVTLSLRQRLFLRYSSSKKFMTLKWGSKVTQGHWEWYHSIDCVWFPISVL